MRWRFSWAVTQGLVLRRKAFIKIVFILALIGVALLFFFRHLCAKSHALVENSVLELVNDLPLNSNCVESTPGYNAFEFSSEPSVVLMWLYTSNISKDRFSVMSFEEFSRESTNLLNAKNSSIFYRNEIESHAAGRREVFFVEISVIKINKELWTCRISISKLL
jgi:hypothetical protein